jgi:phytoene dehydrogenase-like protein
MSERYDVIVIGSGLGGLTAGALFAKEGRRVLVLERNASFGGAASVFRRHGMTVEAGLHELDGLDEEDSKIWLFRRLGILDRLSFSPAPTFFSVRHRLLGDEEFVMPHGEARGRDAVTRRFPEHRGAIASYFRTLCSIRRNVGYLGRFQHGTPARKLATGLALPRLLWPIVRHDRTTVGGLLRRLFGDDERVKLALCANLGYYADDADRFSLIYFSVAQGSYHIGGGHYIKGGSRVLVDLLLELIRDAGGEARAGRTVTGILVEDGRAAGVEHASSRRGGDAEQARAPILVGNAAPHALASMLPAGLRERFMRPYAGRALAPSLWSVYLGLDRPPGRLGLEHYSTFFPAGWMSSLSQNPLNARLLADPPGDRMPGWVVVDYSRVDSGLASGERHLAVVSGLDSLSNWAHLDEESYRKKKACWMDAIVRDLDRRLPGISDHVFYREMATARTMRRYLGTPGGTPYGFAQEVRSAGRHRPRARTPLPGLYLASVFALPGGGFSGALQSGNLAYHASRRFRSGSSRPAGS